MCMCARAFRLLRFPLIKSSNNVCFSPVVNFSQRLAADRIHSYSHVFNIGGKASEKLRNVPPNEDSAAAFRSFSHTTRRSFSFSLLPIHHYAEEYVKYRLRDAGSYFRILILLVCNSTSYPRNCKTILPRPRDAFLYFSQAKNDRFCSYEKIVRIKRRHRYTYSSIIRSRRNRQNINQVVSSNRRILLAYIELYVDRHEINRH